jgi:PhnB protein
MKSKKTAKKSSAAKKKTTAKPAAKSNKPATPDGMHSITPHLVCAGAADAIEYYKKAFGAEEYMRLPGPKGKLIHASVRIGDSIVMLVDEFPEWGSSGPKSLKGSPVTIHLNVPDVDATVAQAVEAGAKITMPVADMFWGARYGRLEDPFGHQWSVSTYIRNVSPEELQKAAAQMGSGR